MPERLQKQDVKIELAFREVREEDIRDLFSWRNHPETRRQSFSTEAVTWDEHRAWFADKINDPNTSIYIVSQNRIKIGSVRFERNIESVRISVMLNPDFIGKRLGAAVIVQSTKKYIQDRNPGVPIIAEIKKENIASIKAFTKAGFAESQTVFIYQE